MGFDGVVVNQFHQYRNSYRVFIQFAYMSRINLVLRFTLVFVAFFVILSPFATVFTPPDPFTQIIALGIVAVIAVPVTLAFVRRSCSVERLYGFLLATYVLTFVVLTLFLGAVFAIETVSNATVRQFGFGWAIAQSIPLIIVYALAFHLVYRGGYTRLKRRFA